MRCGSACRTSVQVTSWSMAFSHLAPCCLNPATLLDLPSSNAALTSSYTYARILFIDFSSAFNTIIPQQLVEKLGKLKVDTGICNWILDFLTQRKQTVRVGSRMSKPTVVNTGSPQDCVLSLSLFTLLTHDCFAR